MRTGAIGTTPEGSDVASRGAWCRSETVLPEDFVLGPAVCSVAPMEPVWYWRSREDGRRVAACGSASVAGPHEFAGLMERMPRGASLLGALPFAPSSRLPLPDSEWRHFAAGGFHLPVLEISQKPGERAVFARHFPAGDRDWGGGAEWVTRWPVASPTGAPRAVDRWDSPCFSEWESGVREVLRAVESGDVRKVVLARKSFFELASEADPFAFLELLSMHSPDCFHFALAPGAGRGAFLGASPELLFRRDGRLLLGEAVAGTRPRSLDAAEDERLEIQLRESPKDIEEHGFVVSAVEDAFRSLCLDYSRDSSPSILKLHRVQHLRTGFAGELRDGVGDREILALLHPTPAVCGTPRDAALERIVRIEGFERGLYAGPLGIVSKAASEFCVSIRSMRLCGRSLDVFAGAGIVGGSDPEREWAELDAKIEEISRIIS